MAKIEVTGGFWKGSFNGVVVAKARLHGIKETVGEVISSAR